MPELSSCLLDGYGVLPSAPLDIRFSNLHTDFGILHWDAPKDLGESVISYSVSFTKIAPVLGEREVVNGAHSPFILETLESAQTYEVFVEAVNKHGVGEASSRIVFRTASRDVDDLLEQKHPYNQTTCCSRANIRKECLPLCSYDASVTTVNALSTLCADDFSSLVRCARVDDY